MSDIGKFAYIEVNRELTFALAKKTAEERGKPNFCGLNPITGNYRFTQYNPRKAFEFMISNFTQSTPPKPNNTNLEEQS